MWWGLRLGLLGCWTASLHPVRTLANPTFRWLPVKYQQNSLWSVAYLCSKGLIIVCPPLHLQGSYKIKYHANGPDADPIEIDFTPPWRRISMVSGLEDVLGIKLPENLESPEARKLLVSVGGSVGWKCGKVGTGDESRECAAQRTWSSPRCASCWWVWGGSVAELWV